MYPKKILLLLNHRNRMITNMKIPCNILRENIAKHEGRQKDHLGVGLQTAGQLEDNVR